jgi:hypothetical protein
VSQDGTVDCRWYIQTYIRMLRCAKTAISQVNENCDIFRVKKGYGYWCFIYER